MRQNIGIVPTYLAVGLAALAAIMSGSQRQFDVDAALLSVLTATANALDMPLDAEQQEQVASP